MSSSPGMAHRFQVRPITSPSNQSPSRFPLDEGLGGHNAISANNNNPDDPNHSSSQRQMYVYMDHSPYPSSVLPRHLATCLIVTRALLIVCPKITTFY